MNIGVITAASAFLGALLGYFAFAALLRRPRRRSRVREGDTNHSILRSVTRLIFVTTQVSALVWVFTSYAIAIYSTVRLGQVYTMAELSEPAIHTILGVGVLKVLENIFEHNNGPVFGQSAEGRPMPEEHTGGEG